MRMKHQLRKELGRQGGDREVEPLDAQAGQPEQHADRRREEPGHDDPHDDADAREQRGELVARVGADPHEPRGAERQQTRVPDEDVQPDRRQRVDQERDHHHVDEEAAAKQRHAHERDEQQDRDPDPVLPQREHRHVGRIPGLELTRFPVEHPSPPGAASPLAARMLLLPRSLDRAARQARPPPGAARSRTRTGDTAGLAKPGRAG